jgi:hypothetical protein
MCIHRYIKYACGHTLPKDPPAVGSPSCTKCAFVLVALHFYHDQPLYRSVEVELKRTIKMPKPCPPVFPTPLNTSTAAHELGASKDKDLARKMQKSGADGKFITFVVNRATFTDLDSHRKVKKTVQADALPPGFVSVFDELEIYQNARDRECNVEYQHMKCGCGYPSPTQKRCLAGWEATDILMYRSGAWNRGPTAKTIQGDITLEDKLFITYAVNPSIPAPADVRNPMPVPLSAPLKELLTEIPPGLVMRVAGASRPETPGSAL